MNFSRLSRFILLIMLTAPLLLSGGCASDATEGIRSVTDAGITHVKTEKVIGDSEDQDLGTDYTATLGKEYGSFKAKLTFDDQCAPKEMTVSASGVGAFQGQQYATAAVTDIQARLSDMGIQLGDQAWSAVGDVFSKYLGLLAPSTDAVPVAPD